MDHTKTYESFINESKDSDVLKAGILKAINAVDESLSYEDFALAVASVLKDEYGTHNFVPFLDVLQKALKQI
jgi:hypothetical protein